MIAMQATIISMNLEKQFQLFYKSSLFWVNSSVVCWSAQPLIIYSAQSVIAQGNLLSPVFVWTEFCTIALNLYLQDYALQAKYPLFESIIWIAVEMKQSMRVSGKKKEKNCKADAEKEKQREWTNIL